MSVRVRHLGYAGSGWEEYEALIGLGKRTTPQEIAEAIAQLEPALRAHRPGMVILGLGPVIECDEAAYAGCIGLIAIMRGRWHDPDASQT